MKSTVLLLFFFFCMVATPNFVFSQNTKNKVFKTGCIPTPKEKLKEIYKERHVPFTLKESAVLPSKLNWADSIYFPPIGYQKNNSCVSWAITYYSLTFDKAYKNKTDLSKAVWNWKTNSPSEQFQDKIMSPYFTYNLSNHGRDKGSSPWYTYDVLIKFGSATWKDIGDKSRDPVFWPSPAVWEKAAKNEIKTYGIIQRNDTANDVTQIKSVLNSGKLLHFTIYAKVIDDTVVTTDELPKVTRTSHTSWGYHYVTIVGYDDNYEYKEGGIIKKGAFIIANSWGDNWGPFNNGTFMISYEAVKNRIGLIYFIQLKENYNPNLFAILKINHARRNECVIGIRKKYFDAKKQINEIIPFYTFYIDDNFFNSAEAPFPKSGIAMDLTESFALNKKPVKLELKLDDILSATTGKLIDFSLKSVQGKDTLLFDSFSKLPISTINNSTVKAEISPIKYVINDQKDTLDSREPVKIQMQKLWDAPIDIDLSLDSIHWESIKKKTTMKNVSFQLRNCSSTRAQIRVCYSNQKDVYYSHNVHITGPTDIRILNSFNKVLNYKEVIPISIEKSSSRPVNIYLRQGQIIVDTLTENFNDSVFNWTVKNICGGKGYFIQVCDTSGNYAFSDKFEIRSPFSVKILNYKEDFLQSETVKLKISKPNDVTAYNLSIVNQDTNFIIAKNVTDEAYNWTIPTKMSYGKNFVVYATDINDEYVAKTSTTFTILPLNKWKHSYLALNPAYPSGFTDFRTPAIYDNKVFVSGPMLYILDSAGNILKNFKGDCASINEVVISENGSALYNVNQESSSPNYFDTYCFSPDGNQKWKANLLNGLWGIMGMNDVSSFDNNFLLNPVYADSLKCISTEGKKIWSIVLNEHYMYINNTPAISAGKFIYFLSNRKFYKIDSKGNEIWNKKKFTSDGWSEAYEGTLIVGLDQSIINTFCGYWEEEGKQGITKFSPDGKIIWSYSGTGSYFEPAIGQDGNLIVADSKNKKIVSLNPYGELNWEIYLESFPLTTPTIGESGNIYVVDDRQNIICISPLGEIMWQLHVGNPFPVDKDHLGEMRLGSCTIDKKGRILFAGYRGKFNILSSSGETGLAKTAWPKIGCDLRNSNHQSNRLKISVVNKNYTYKGKDTIKLSVNSNFSKSTKIVSYRSVSNKNWTELVKIESEDSAFSFIPPNANTAYELKVYVQQNPGYVDFTDKRISVSCNIPDPTVNAGDNDIICENKSYKLQGSAENYSSVVWRTSGDGTFSDSTSLNAVYTPGKADIAADSAVLTLQANPMAHCDSTASDNMALYIRRMPEKPETPQGPGTILQGTDLTTDYTIDAVKYAKAYTWHLSPDKSGTIAGNDTTGTVTWSSQFTGTKAFVYVTASNKYCGSVTSDSLKVTLSPVGISHKEKENSIMVTPNPTYGKFTLTLNDTKDYRLTVVNSTGQVVLQKTLKASQMHKFTLDLGYFPAGIYYLRLVSNREIVIKKLMLNKTF